MYYIIVNEWSAIKTYDTLQGAKTAFTRKYLKKYPNAQIMDSEEFKQHKENEPYHDVVNIMSGQVVKEKVSTPHFLSVSSESYWSS